MHKVVAGVAVTGIIAAIAAGARQELLPRLEDAGAGAASPSAWSPRALPRRLAPDLPAPAPASSRRGNSSCRAPAAMAAMIPVTATPATTLCIAPLPIRGVPAARLHVHGPAPWRSCKAKTPRGEGTKHKGGHFGPGLGTARVGPTGCVGLEWRGGWRRGSVGRRRRGMLYLILGAWRLRLLASSHSGDFASLCLAVPVYSASARCSGASRMRPAATRSSRSSTEWAKIAAAWERKRSSLWPARSR